VRRSPPRSRQQGIALLTAILLVALGTILATAMAYQNAMTARRGEATFAFDQSILIAQAGEAIAAYALRESRNQSKGGAQDSPDQFWGMPLGPVEIVPGVTLEASLEDMSGRFNLNNLVNADGSIDKNAEAIFANLLQILGLETKWAPLIADWIDADSITEDPEGAEDNTYLSQNPPYRAANRQITSASELLALPGFGRNRYLTLQPYVTALPRATRINTCTAQGPVLDSLLPNGEHTWSTLPAQQLAKQRMSGNGCSPTVQDLQASFTNDAASTYAAGQIAMVSDYFRLTCIVDVGTLEFRLYSLLHREGGNRMHVIQRSFTAD